jgi:hypothetical protein
LIRAAKNSVILPILHVLLIKKLEKAYKSLHNDTKADSNEGIKDVLKYITWRIEAKCSFTNMFKVMQWRYENIYKRIYQLELKLHNNDETKVLKCLRKKLGTTKEAYAILDFKDEPTFLTKAAMFVGTVLTYIFQKRVTLPVVKLFAFIFDITKDLGLAVYMGNILLPESSNYFASADDYNIFATYILSLCLGQTLISLFAVKNNKVAFSLCPHDTTTLENTLLYGAIVIFFPATGVIMATDCYFNAKNLEKDFERIAKQIDWSHSVIRKNEFEGLITKLNFIEEQEKLGGFEMLKVVENAIESFLQVGLVILIFVKLPYEGILNKQIFGLAQTEESHLLEILQAVGLKTDAKLFFLVSCAMGYLFIATGIVSYIVVIQKQSMGMKHKLILILLYLLKIATSLLTFCLLLSISNNGFMIWSCLILVKSLIIFINYLVNERKNIQLLEIVLKVVCNMNLPIHLSPFEDPFSANLDHPKISKPFVFVWIVSGVENIVRSILIFQLLSPEIVAKLFPSITLTVVLSLVIMIELIVISFWYLFFKKLYIWANVFDITEEAHEEVRESTALEHMEEREEEESSIALSMNEMDEKVKTTRAGKTLKRCETFHHCTLNPINDKHDLKRSISESDIRIKGINTSDENEDISNESFYDKLKKRVVKCKSCKCVDFSRVCTLKTLFNLLFGLLLTFSIMFLVASSKGYFTQQQLYKDCFEVNIKNNQKEGIYKLRLNVNEVYTYCKQGWTLIQKTDPDVGNRKYYFDRDLNDYENGFGFADKEMFLGLKHIYSLNKEHNNTILRLELTKHDLNRTSYLVEYDSFDVLRLVSDDIHYNGKGLLHIRNQNESYPIVSLGNITSSNVNEGQFVFARPSYYEGSLEDRKRDRNQVRSYYDHLYLSFKTLDNLLNNDCSRKFRSGWWFPYSIKLDNGKWSGIGINGNGINGPCSYNEEFGTNLNGYFDQDVINNKRMIGFCKKDNIHDCISPTKNDRGYIKGWKYKNMKSIKLRTTKMWLGRRIKKEEDD